MYHDQKPKDNIKARHLQSSLLDATSDGLPLDPFRFTLVYYLFQGSIISKACGNCRTAFHVVTTIDDASSNEPLFLLSRLVKPPF